MGSAESITFHFLEEKVKSKSIWKNVNICQILMTMDVSVCTISCPETLMQLVRLKAWTLIISNHPSGLQTRAVNYQDFLLPSRVFIVAKSFLLPSKWAKCGDGAVSKSKSKSWRQRTLKVDPIHWWMYTFYLVARGFMYMHYWWWAILPIFENFFQV